jgi:hypothetical protein
MSDFIKDAKKAYMNIEPTEVNVEGLPTFFIKPLTIHQAQAIGKETDDFTRMARVIQVRARNEDGSALVKPSDFLDFCRFISADVIGEACTAILATNNSEEESEKNS